MATKKKTSKKKPAAPTLKDQLTAYGTPHKGPLWVWQVSPVHYVIAASMTAAQRVHVSDASDRALARKQVKDFATKKVPDVWLDLYTYEDTFEHKVNGKHPVLTWRQYLEKLQEEFYGGNIRMAYSCSFVTFVPDED